MNAKLGFGVVEMEGGRATRNAENASDLPGGFTLGSPLEAFEFTWGQRYAVDNPVRNELAPGMGVKIHSHELKHAAVLHDTPFELRMPLVGGKGHRGDGAAMIVNWDCKPGADAEPSSLLEQFPLGIRLCC